jgi:adenylate cyclase
MKPRRVLVIQSDSDSAQILEGYVKAHGAITWRTTNTSKIFAIIEQKHPDLVFLDIHLPKDKWLDILIYIRQKFPGMNLIVTNKYPDVKREMLAKEQGAEIFLREPFTHAWIDNALKRIDNKEKTTAVKSLPKVRLPMRVKITLPYVLLALLVAVAFTFIVSRFIIESLNERFTNQLIDAGTLSADWIVREEDRMLDTLRLVANTEGIAGAVISQDTGMLYNIILPIAVNYQEESISILDKFGTSIISMQHKPDDSIDDYQISKGETEFSQEDFVNKVLQQELDERGDKFAGVLRSYSGDQLYIVGPIFDDSGDFLGAVLIGKTLDTIVQSIREDTLAQVSLYDNNGYPIASSIYPSTDVLPLSNDLAIDILGEQDRSSNFRPLTVGSMNYTEVLGPLEIRGGEDQGIMGISLPQNYIFHPSTITRIWAYAIISIAFLGIGAVGILLARQITLPLTHVVKASTEIAHGNLEVKVPTTSNDEMSVVAHAFNYMVSGLQEGLIYRDLLGRTVSPEVRDALRQSFAKGDLRLEGQNTIATVLLSDIRRFTSMSEKIEPTTIFNWLNEYFGELVPIVTSHGGVIDKFEGDAMLTFFGIFPTPLTPSESAYQACSSGLEMLKTMEIINNRRNERNEPLLVTGVTIITGEITAGGLGTSDRLDYTIIGDTVNVAQRMQDITRQFPKSSIVVSESTLEALGEARADFYFDPLGEHSFKGKYETLWMYRLLPDSSRIRTEPIPIRYEKVDV